MSALSTFDFEGNAVRIQDQNGEPWFVGKDVCGALGISDHHQSLKRLDDDERGYVIVPTPSGDQQMICVNEFGAYQLVFTSRTDDAKRFKRWLAHEVLPQIRRTGGYGSAAPALDQDPDEIRLYLALVNECRRTYGRSAARKMWGQLPLPQVMPANTNQSLTVDGYAPMMALDGDGCLRHLLNWDGWGEGGLAAAVALAAENTEYRPALRERGIIVHPQGWQKHIAVARISSFLEEVFAGTDWEHARWAEALLDLDPVQAAPNALRFGKDRPRAVMVPFSLVLGVG